MDKSREKGESVFTLTELETVSSRPARYTGKVLSETTFSASEAVKDYSAKLPDYHFT